MQCYDVFSSFRIMIELFLGFHFIYVYCISDFMIEMYCSLIQFGFFRRSTQIALLWYIRADQAMVRHRAPPQPLQNTIRTEGNEDSYPKNDWTLNFVMFLQCQKPYENVNKEKDAPQQMRIV